MRIRFGTTNPASDVDDIIAKGTAEIAIHGLAATLIVKQGAQMGIVTLTNEEIIELAMKAGVFPHAVRKEATHDRVVSN